MLRIQRLEAMIVLVPARSSACRLASDTNRRCFCIQPRRRWKRTSCGPKRCVAHALVIDLEVAEHPCGHREIRRKLRNGVSNGLNSSTIAFVSDG